MIDRDKLAALHERATKGEWVIRDHCISPPDNLDRVKIDAVQRGPLGSFDRDNATLIALLCSESARAEILALMDERDRLREALTPSAETKAAYMNEFSFWSPELDELGDEYMRSISVPWTTIKTIMAAIRARAAPGE